MSLKEKLQIILITYNRATHAKRTLETFLTKNSPVQDCNLLILDNNSTDETAQVAKDFQQKYPNVSYQKNRYNLGISGNIARAMEMANQEYVWIIGDDDIYDFTHWQEVEEAITREEKMICVSNYALPKGHEHEIPYQLFQLTFITGGIYHTSLFNDTTIRNSYDGLYTLFPHLPPIIALLNEGGTFYLLKNPIAYNGWKRAQTDSSYTRGTRDVSMLTKRTQQMTWILGYANILTLIKNSDLITACMDVAIAYPDIFLNEKTFYQYCFHLYRYQRSHFYEIYFVLSKKRRKKIRNDILKCKVQKFFHCLEKNPYE